MTSIIRKIISVVCAVALLMSLCTVSFIGSSSALHLDAVESDNTTANFDVVKAYDFNSASGFGYRRFLDGIEFVIYTDMASDAFDEDGPSISMYEASKHASFAEYDTSKAVIAAVEGTAE